MKNSEKLRAILRVTLRDNTERPELLDGKTAKRIVEALVRSVTLIQH